MRVRVTRWGGLIVAATVLGTLGLSACGSSNSASGDASGGGSPVPGGTLSFGINTEADCLDPHQSAADVAGFFARPMLDSLVSLSADGGIHPWLATSWSVSPDQKTYSFTLRSDVTFTNGEKFDGAAVKANLDHIVAPATKSQLAAGTISSYQGTTVVDPTHVEVHFSTPSSAFLPTLATAYLGMEAPSTLTQPPANLCTKIVGTGPFTSDGGYIKGKGIDYARNPAYKWAPKTASHDGPAYLNAISIKVLKEDASRFGALTSGQIDSIASVPPVDIGQLKALSGFAVQTAAAPGGNYNYYPNTTKGPFTDVNVRKAFREGIDWATIVNKRYFGAFEPAKNPLSPTTVGYDKSVESAYAYDVADANKLLDAAGWTGRDSAGFRTKNGVRLTVVHPFPKAFTREQRDTLADQLQAAAKQIGFDVQNTSVDVSTYVSQISKGDYDLADLSWQRASPDALRTLFGSANVPKRGFSTNLSRLVDPAVDKDLFDALGTTDLAPQAALYADAQRRITDAVAVFPVYVFSYVLGSSKNVHDIRFEPQAYPTFYDAWKRQ
jgi:peptide/nickel transport system substrate-binding protein